MKTIQASFREFIELLALPNDSNIAGDIPKNVDWLEAAFRRRGFLTQRLPNADKPMLFAEYGRKNPASGTVLLYMHLDGKPVIPEQWAQENPYVAVVKQRNAQGEWEALPIERLLAGTIDPDWRLFARSSADDKGPIMMLLAAFDALKAKGREPAVNVKVILDSEEEEGSPTIAGVARAHADLLKADALIVCDGPKHASEQPTLVLGNRGNTVVRLTVYGPRTNLHSGHYGNYAPNPAQRLAALLASMKDEETGRVTIPGYYDRIAFSDAERQLMAAVPDDEAAIRARIGIAKNESVGANYQEALQYPSLNVRGMAAAVVGSKAATIIPSHAVAELDVRTTPEADKNYLFGLIEKHVVGKGYYLVEGEPTNDERARYDRLASLVLLRGSSAARTPLESPLGQWTLGVLQETFCASPIVIRMMGGSVPTDKLVAALKIPFVIIPLVNGDNNQHAADENLRVGHYLEGVKTMMGLVRSPYPKA
jgi:acetylornithine deacetylase/succinyl-diaminopimelate desuccinylase-like protein